MQDQLTRIPAGHRTRRRAHEKELVQAPNPTDVPAGITLPSGSLAWPISSIQQQGARLFCCFNSRAFQQPQWHRDNNCGVAIFQALALGDVALETLIAEGDLAGVVEGVGGDLLVT